MSGRKGYYPVLPGYYVSTPRTREHCSERLSEVYTKLHEIGADSAAARASAILSGLQVRAPRAICARAYTWACLHACARARTVCARVRARVGMRARTCVRARLSGLQVAPRVRARKFVRACAHVCAVVRARV